MKQTFDFLGELKALCAKLELNKEVAPFDEAVEAMTNDLARVREIKDDSHFDEAFWDLRANYDAFAKLRKNHAEYIIRELERIKKAVATAYDAEQNELIDLNNSFWEGKQPDA
jgi:esterase/lipase